MATGDCATCDFWKRKASPIKGRLIPGGTGKCTRKEGLCENPKPKDPHSGWKVKPKKEKGASPLIAPGSQQSFSRKMFTFAWCLIGIFGKAVWQ
jgi:hypothetical protein